MSIINFFCNLAEATMPLPHFWEHTVGSDHAPVALRADWQRQLQRSHDELGFRYVRFHGLLCDDMGTLVREKNKLLYFNADQIFDFLPSIGMKPFVELRLKDSTLTLLLTNHTTPGHSIETGQIHVRVDNALKPVEAFTQRIDAAHQLSHMWIDFRGIQDEYMSGKAIDYFENSRRAVYVQQAYAMRNPKRLRGYDRYCWGITASDGPGPAVRRISGRTLRFYDYVARAIPYGPDDGTLAPWAVAGSLPFAPEVVMPSLRRINRDYSGDDKQIRVQVQL